MQRDYNGYNYHSCLIRVLKSQKNKLVPSYLRFFVAVKKNDWMIHENLFLQTNQYSVISFTRENSKMFNTTSKYFSNFNNKPLTSWVAHIAKDFCLLCVLSLCHSCHTKKLEEIENKKLKIREKLKTLESLLRYKLNFLSHHPLWVMQLYGQDPLKVSHHPGKSGGIGIVAVRHNGFNLLRELGRLRE